MERWVSMFHYSLHRTINNTKKECSSCRRKTRLRCSTITSSRPFISRESDDIQTLLRSGAPCSPFSHSSYGWYLFWGLKMTTFQTKQRKILRPIDDVICQHPYRKFNPYQRWGSFNGYGSYNIPLAQYMALLTFWEVYISCYFLNFASFIATPPSLWWLMKIFVGWYWINIQIFVQRTRLLFMYRRLKYSSCGSRKKFSMLFLRIMFKKLFSNWPLFKERRSDG